MDTLLLEMAGISKRYGATVALDDVSLGVETGRVHALVGENGAGKSTLMKILAGIVRPDKGTMSLAGERFAPTGPAQANAAGVAMIHQELTLAPHLSVEANLLLGQERSRLGWIRRSEHRALARQALARLSQDDLPLDVPVGNLPMALQQLVEITRALVSNSRVLVFDEPTSSLTEEDRACLFEAIGDLRRAGLGIVYISHFLEEVAEIADDYTVLRDGRLAGTGSMQDVTLDDIVRLMVGRELSELFPRVEHEPGEPLLRLDQLSGDPMPQEADLVLRRGEILGLAGLIGAGRSELLRTVFGLNRRLAGRAEILGRTEVARSARHSIANGLGFVSEDRKDEGLALTRSIADNLTYTRLGHYARAGWLNLRRRESTALEWMQEIECKAASPRQPIEQLSGGNQQKIAIARLLHQQADVLLLDEPTRGIDIATKSQIYRLMGTLAADGKAILFVSSYLPELLNVCDRVGVMCRGRLREIRPAEQWSEEEIMHCATGREAAV